MTAPLIPVPADKRANFAWVDDARLQRVVSALENVEPGSARFVGGCVRDSLIGAALNDIDLATTLRPDAVIAALKSAGLAVALTGLDHGTVTAIADHFPVEVTTLRADVATDGRRATVAFTTDWAVDAARRDFTINALYLTPDRMLADTTGGLDDIKARRVRFIGRPQDRIREDYLRILRFFRFSARFAASFDAEGLAACAKDKDGLARLSAERIGDEMMKLLALAAPMASLSAMTASGVLSEIWNAEPRLETLGRLKALDPGAPGSLALAALYAQSGEGIDARLRLSNAQGQRRRKAVRNAARIDPDMAEHAAHALLYEIGAEAWKDACLIAHANYLTDDETPDRRDPRFSNLETLPDRWPPPALPFSGKDAIAAGVASGPDVTRVMKAAEARWIAEDFPASRRAMEILHEEAGALLKK